MKGRSVQPGTAKFVAIAIVFMVICDQFLFGGSRPYIDSAREEVARKVEAQKALQEEPPPVPPAVVRPEDGKEFFEAPVAVPEVTEKPKSPPSIAPLPSPRPRGDKGGSYVPHGAPKVAIIIDDLGMDVRRSKQILELPAPITLAFLPYAPKTKEMAKDGKGKGHSLIIHTPMEAMDGKLNIGPGGLKEAMSESEFDTAFGAMLASFDGYEGINNHMGSRLTTDDAKMKHLMQILRDHNLFFVDSKTNPASVAAGEAQMAGIPFAERDVFLDHVETLDFAREALQKTERLALKRGYAIAIGHPKDNTIAALKEWLPTLAAKGIELVPVKALLVHPENNSISAKAGIHEAAVTVDPRVRGDAEKEKSGDAIDGEEIVKEEKLPQIPDMFPEDLPIAVPEPASGAPQIQLHPLPEQSPAPSSPIP